MKKIEIPMKENSNFYKISVILSEDENERVGNMRWTFFLNFQYHP